MPYPIFFQSNWIRMKSESDRKSVITPAQNEENYIEGCLPSVAAAVKRVSRSLEQIVVLNRCTDRTEAIATWYGANPIGETG